MRFLWQTKWKIEANASAFPRNHRSIFPDTRFHLQTVLFTLACTCTLVLALGSIELVGEVETDALAIVMFGHHTR